MTSLVDEHETGPLPVVKSRVGWVGEPQHTRPPEWPGSQPAATLGLPVEFDVEDDPRGRHICQFDVACAHPDGFLTSTTPNGPWTYRPADPRLLRFRFNTTGQPVSGPRHRPRKGQS